MLSNIKIDKTPVKKREGVVGERNAGRAAACVALVPVGFPTLLIVESPSKCKKIEEYLGSQYKCIASKGHFRNIKNLKSIKTQTTFEPTFEMDKDKLEHITEIKTIIQSFPSSQILLATDDDREGEAIAWHLCEVFGLSLETPRIIFHEITQQALQHAVQNPTKINMGLVFSQQTRQILDMVVGFKISPFLWKYLYNNKTKSLSAGRCQTPALRLVYDNERNKKEENETKYKTSGLFFDKQYTFDLNIDFDTEQKMMDFLEESTHFNNYNVIVGKNKESVRNPPLPLNTSSLLQYASSILHYSPKQTMKLCQELYQQGDITYMRTENTKYSSSFIKEVSLFIVQNYGDQKYIGDVSRIEDSEKEETVKKANPHEAIRVTHLEVLSVEGSEQLNTMYNMIRKHTIESCMASAVYQVTNIEISAPQNKKYIYMIEIPIFLGWKKYSLENDSNSESESGKLFYFQSLRPGSMVHPNRIDSIVSITRKHSHYTEASLIKKLEDLGIGRPSTFASLVETIVEREYVKKQDIVGENVDCVEFEMTRSTNSSMLTIQRIVRKKLFGKEKNKLVITSLGTLTIEFLLNYFEPIFNYNYTKKMELLLEDKFTQLEDGVDWEKNRELICKECYQMIKELSKPLTGVEKKVYQVKNSEYEVVFQAYGPSLRRKMSDDTIEYKAIGKEINVDLLKLERGEYTFEELVEIKKDEIGEYEGEIMRVKVGQYGPYVEWGTNKKSIKSIAKPLNEITIDDVVQMMDLERQMNEESTVTGGDAERSRPKMPTPSTYSANMLRFISNDLSIRKNVKTGKPYIFYKTVQMNKPEFYSLKKYTDTFMKCDVKVLKEWIMTTYIV